LRRRSSDQFREGEFVEPLENVQFIGGRFRFGSTTKVGWARQGYLPNVTPAQKKPTAGPWAYELMEAEGIEPSSQVNVGLYMFSRSFDLDVNDEDRHPSLTSRRLYLANSPTPE
jgi:hypothetical protein